MSADAYIRPYAAAAMLGVSIDRLRHLARTGRIATVRTLGGHRRYCLDDVEAVGRWLTREAPA